MKRIACMIISLSLIGGVGLRAEDGHGGRAAAFLQLDLSARALGMGGVFTGIADDASALFYNPAGIAQLSYNAFNASYRAMSMDRRLGFISANFPVRNEATISLGWIFAGDNQIEGRDEEGEPTGEDLGYSENTIEVAFARTFGPFFMAGGSGKYFITKVANLTTTTIGFDVGVMLVLDKEALGQKLGIVDLLRVGITAENLAAVRHLSTGEYWGQFGGIGVSVEERFPIGVAGGISAQGLDSSLLVGVDLEKYSQQNLRFFAGGEYLIKSLLALRAGYGDGRPAFGVGLFRKFEYYVLRFDYAFAAAKHGEGSDHLITVGFDFR